LFSESLKISARFFFPGAIGVTHRKAGKLILLDRSIKSRVTLFTLIILVLCVWFLAFYAERLSLSNIEFMSGERQFSTVSLAAADLDEEVHERLNELERIAAALSPAMSGNPAALQALTEQHRRSPDVFNAGTFVTGMDGTVMASVPTSLRKIGVNDRDSDHAVASLQEGKATVGDPVVDKVLNVPVVSMSVPIRDAQGKLIGGYWGLTDLAKPNFLDKISASRYGKDGGYLVVAPRARIIVTATDKKRVLEVLPAAGVNRYVDRNIGGYEGYSVLVNALGEEQLAAVKKIPAAGWYMLLGMPSSELFAPIHSIRLRLLVMTIILTLLAGTLIWWMLRRELLPMQTTLKIMAEIGNSDLPRQDIPVVGQGEIAELIGGFNHLLATLRNENEALIESEGRSRSIIEASPVPMGIIDAQGKITYVNQAFLHVVGYALEDIPTLVTGWTRAFPDPQYRQQIAGEWRKNMEEAKRTGQPFPSRELEIRCHDNAVRIFMTSITPISGSSFEKRREAKNHLVILFDITERRQREELVKEHNAQLTLQQVALREAEQDARHLAYFDPLTNLPNRRMLVERLQSDLAQAKRFQRVLAVMFIDLDNFKEVNDTLGHDVGDELLQEVANRLSTCIRSGDIVSRPGGDEFIIVLPQIAQTADAAVVAEKIIKIVAEPLRIKDRVLNITASIGIALYPFNGSEEQELMKNADKAMYVAKKAGRNRFHLYVDTAEPET
jgi:diguanylate cyclase (GGDEF)-like protein/PAS domain S-box-containing protein